MRGKFDKLFQSDQSAWLKIAGGAILGPLFVIPMILRGEQRGEMEPYAYSDLFWIGVGASLFGALLGAILCMKDRVTKQLQKGTPVAWPLRIMFGGGIGFLLFWSIILSVVIITGLVVSTGP